MNASRPPLHQQAPAAGLRRAWSALAALAFLVVLAGATGRAEAATVGPSGPGSSGAGAEHAVQHFAAGVRPDRVSPRSGRLPAAPALDLDAAARPGPVRVQPRTTPSLPAAAVVPPAAGRASGARGPPLS